jgi:hypothetical protein
VLGPVARDETHAVIRWLMSDARKRVDPSEFLQAFADELCAAGRDLSRVTHGRQGWPNPPGMFPLQGSGVEQEIFAPSRWSDRPAKA